MKLKNLKNWISISGNGGLKGVFDKGKEVDPSITDDESEYFFSSIFDDKSPGIPLFLIQKQKELKSLIKGPGHWFNIVAPTSFGKTMVIIETLIGTKSIVISPTIALCNEYFLKLKSIDASIRVSTTFISNDDVDIFILTPEKATLLFDTQKIKFDYAVFDEFYEAYSSWARFPKFRDSLAYCLDNAKKVITISPKKVKMPFESFKFTPINFKTDLSATTRKITTVHKDSSKTVIYNTLEKFTSTGSVGFPAAEYSKNITKDDIILKHASSGRATLVLSSKRNMVENASKISDKQQSIKRGPIVNEIVEYLRENSPNLMLEKLLNKGIAYHNGSVDKFVRFLIEEAFKRKEIKILYANSTLTKGVNLNPDVLIMDSFSKIRGQTPENHQIERINAYGRAGRIGSDSVIGEVVVFSSSFKKAKEEISSVVSKEIIDIVEPQPEIPKKVDSISAAYKMLLNNIYDNYTLSEKQGEVINKYLVSRTRQNVSDIISLAFSYFQIDFPGKSSSYWENVIDKNLTNMGYKGLYEYRKTQFRNKGYVVLGYGKASAATFQEVQEKIKWANENEKPRVRYYEYSEKQLFTNDWALMDIIDDYENIVGFQFKQLLLFLIKKAQNEGFIQESVYKSYLKSSEEDGIISTNMGWPDAFGKYYIFKQKTEKIKDKINRIMEIIKKG